MNYVEKEPFEYKVLIHIALCTGCRRAELAALQWSDILWDKKQIVISKSVYQINGKKGIKSPKTVSSNRTIAIPDYMLQLLRQYKKYQLEQQLLTQIPNQYNMLFTDKYGDYLPPVAITNWFQHFLKKNNLKHIKFHSLRHQKVNSKAKILFSFLQKICYFPFDFYAIFFKNINFINKKINEFFTKKEWLIFCHFFYLIL